MKMKKIVAVASALSLTAAIAIGGTLAYLTKPTGPVTNTFTYNSTNQKIDLTLQEHPLKADKVSVDKDGDPTNANTYTILPGVKVEKDPFLTLTTNNPSYIYVEVVNGATDYIDKIYTTVDGVDKVFGEEGSGWTELKDVTAPHNGTIYYLDAAALGNAGTTDSNIPVFNFVQYKNTVPTVPEGEESVSGNITIYGYAIAVTGMGDVTNAWKTAVSDFMG